MVDAPLSRVSDYIVAFFNARPHLRVRGPASLSVRVEIRHELADDVSDQAWRHDSVAFRWKPPWPVFPNFAAVLTVRPEYPGSVLTLEGSYEPPGAAVGRLFDRVAGGWLATITVDDLLRRLRHDIRVRHAAFVRSCPSIEELNARERQRVGRHE